MLFHYAMSGLVFGGILATGCGLVFFGHYTAGATAILASAVIFHALFHGKN